MQPTEEKKIARALELRIARKKFGFRVRRNLRRFNAEGRNFFARLVKSEGLPGEHTLLFRSEDDGCGVTQHTIFRPGPVEHFFEMLKRERSLEPGIEHAVRENEIRNRRTCVTPPRREAQVLPKPVD